MTDTYLVLLPIGSEGPFSCDELRSRLAAGKVRSTDRVMHALTRHVCALTDIIPEAGEASKARAPVSERIRRSNSDRHVAVQQSSQRLQLAAPTPAAPSVLESTPPQATPSSTPTPAAPEIKKPRNPAVTIAVLIAITLALFLIWRPSSRGGVISMQMSDLSGVWKSLPNAKSAPLEITLQADTSSLTITDSNGSRRAKATVEFSDGGVLVVSLTPADPQFGQRLQFSRSVYGMTFGTMGGPRNLDDGSLLMVKTTVSKPTEAPVEQRGSSK